MIGSLNDVPGWLLRRARSLGDAGQVRELLQQHTAPESWEYLKPFIDDVVFGGEPAPTWLRGQVVVPDWSLADLLRLDRAALLAPLGGDFRDRVAPALDDWRGGVSWVGAPALPVPDADYRYAVPEHAIGLGRAGTERVADSVVAFRRWIASRLAFYLLRTSSPAAEDRYAGLPPIDEWSRDAVLARQAWLREQRELPQSTAAVPGMRAPDHWYREPTDSC